MPTEKDFSTLDLVDSLFNFAMLEYSPDPDKLRSAAIQTMKESPLSSMFPVVRMDSEGKSVHRSGSGRSGEFAEGALERTIAQNESIRRKLVVLGRILPSRNVVMKNHYVDDDVLCLVLQQSPFVPQDLVSTFGRGLTRFFHGDFVSALYILTPLLENSLRHVLKQRGVDVTTFDDATKTQKDRTLGTLFEYMRGDIEGAFSRRIVADIENVFRSEFGPGIRDDLAHGLLHDGFPYGADAIYACWLIYQLCLIPLFSHREEVRSILQ